MVSSHSGNGKVSVLFVLLSTTPEITLHLMIQAADDLWPGETKPLSDPTSLVASSFSFELKRGRGNVVSFCVFMLSPLMNLLNSQYNICRCNICNATILTGWRRLKLREWRQFSP
jgi:hypothetical protein